LIYALKKIFKLSFNCIHYFTRLCDYISLTFNNT